ncbi:MAG: hypothetical protein ABJC74_15770 [Gemmatimonadota bacterium]
MAPPDKKKKTAWTSGKGKKVHPRAPAGSGGAGTFTSPKPLAHDWDKQKPLAHPNSPVGTQTAPIDQARDTSVPPPPSLDMRAEMLRVSKAAVGQPVISNPANQGRIECYDMVEKLLTDIGAKSAPAFTKSGTVGKNDDYVWGDKISLKDVKPGDILQIRDSEVHRIVKTEYKALQPGTAARQGETVTTKMFRGHHTAVVIAINPDGSFQVSEQHVLNEKRDELSRSIVENTLPIKAIDGDPATSKVDSGTQQKKVTTRWEVVSGKLYPYRPVSKPKM